MEQAGDTTEAGSVPDGLGHSLRDIKPLHLLDLDMYPGQPYQVGHFAIGL